MVKQSDTMKAQLNQWSYLMKKVSNKIAIRNLLWAISNRSEQFINDIYGKHHGSYMEEKIGMVASNPIQWWFTLDEEHQARAIKVANGYYSN